MDYDYDYHIKKDGVDFYAPSTRKGKKYDAYVNGKKYAFGSIYYQQYHDKLKYYKDLDHHDEQRRYNYIRRHIHDDLDHYSPGYFSMFYLWN